MEKKHNSLYELYLKDAYDTTKINLGRPIETWSKEKKVEELRLLCKQFKHGWDKSFRQRTCDLIMEIVDTLRFPENITKEDLLALVIELKKHQATINGFVTWEGHVNKEPYLHFEDKAMKALDRMQFLYEKTLMESK
ncbi:hypothetical protein ACXYMT_02500 [Salinimicrobium sp. CAU 1759]